MKAFYLSYSAGPSRPARGAPFPFAVPAVAMTVRGGHARLPSGGQSPARSPWSAGRLLLGKRPGLARRTPSGTHAHSCRVACGVGNRHGAAPPSGDAASLRELRSLDGTVLAHQRLME